MSLIQDKFIASVYMKANGSVPASANTDMGGFKITNLGTPTNPTDAVTKAYADAGSSPVSSVFARTGAVTAQSGDYTTAQVTESGNLYFTEARAIASVLTGFVSGAGTVSSADSILQAIQKIVGNIAGLVTGVSTVFGRSGAVTAQSGDYTTAQVTESGNLYFTNARGIASTLTGYTAGAGTVTSADTILQALQKLDGNIKTPVKETPSGTVNGSNVTFTLSFSPVAASLAVYVDGILDTAYSLSTNTITFTTAPAVGQTVYAMYLK